MIRMVDDAFKKNRRVFVRLSGSIGDPLLNPATFALIQWMNRHHVSWGITDNGLTLPERYVKELLSAEWIQISLDAGSNRTYVELKQNRRYEDHPGDPFDRVLRNIGRLVHARRRYHASSKIIVSMLVQRENFLEIDQVSRLVKSIGVDGYQIKMQHFDERRQMAPEQIDHLFDAIIPHVVERDQDRHYKVMIVQDKKTAHAKNEGQLIQLVTREALERAQPYTPIDFPFCRSQLINAVASAAGQLEPCCHYFMETLDSWGNIAEMGLDEIWTSSRRIGILLTDPRGICRECPPTDLFLNRFFHFLEKCARFYPHLIDKFRRWTYHAWMVDRGRNVENGSSNGK
jgi:MoaA/NifB/PqqE/SkfB family radical SAM enzyme